MNRQTMLVTGATLALVILGAILLYASPGGSPTRPGGGGAKTEKVAKNAKAKGDKSKGKTPAPNKLPVEQLVHAGEIPADRPAAPAGAPNVVLLVLSTQRKDQWSVYGGPAEVTPFLGGKAKGGTVMGDALSVAVEPHIASAALVTGMYPAHIGLVQLGEKKNNRPIADDAQTLGERFAAGGWFTVGLTANHVLNQSWGGAAGFDWYRDAQQFSLMNDLRIDADDLVAATLERVGARTDAEKARPLFLEVAFVDSHKPIKIPPEEFQPFGGPNGEVAPYRASVRRQDDAVSKLVAGLAAQGLNAENTVFVVVADNGEGLDMPAHHRKQHGFVLYGSSVQIPWVLWGKGIPAGKTVDGLASQIDVAPTVVALAGVAAQGNFDGMDLSAAVLGKGKSPRTRAYADTTYEGMHRASIWTSAHQCQKDYGSKTLDGDQFVDGCFDRKTDPDFTTTIQDATLTAELEKLHGELMTGVGPSDPADAAPTTVGE